MAELKVGDTIFFPSVSRLVNEGTVMDVDGIYIKVKADGIGCQWIMETSAFHDRAGLLKSDAYEKAWAQQQERRRYNEMFNIFAAQPLY